MTTRRATIMSLNGMVCAAHPLAAQAGAGILRAGGNAFDAAVTTAAALNVVEPFMSGLAGQGMATCYIARERRIRTLDFVMGVPKAFPIDSTTSVNQITRGPLAVGIPANLAGWCELRRAYGRKSLEELLAPAIALARGGFPLTPFGAAALAEADGELRGHAELHAGWSAVYLAGIDTPAAGAVLRQPDLAETYEAIASDGAAYLLGGHLGKTLLAHVRALGGCLQMADLESVAPAWADPFTVTYRDLSFSTLTPPCEGFQCLLALKILEGFDMGALDRDSVAHVDLVLRAVRLAAGERIRNNKPDAATLAGLFDATSLERLRRRVRDGVPIEGPTEHWLAPRPIDRNGENTTAISVVDADGNAVSITQSLGSVFGSAVVVPGTGVCLNNFNKFGDIDPRANNYLQPGAPLANPMTPLLATRDGDLVLSLGTPGTYGIGQTLPQAIVQYLDYGLDLQAAIEAPRVRLWDGRRADAESRLSSETIDGLRQAGHEVTVAPAWTRLVGGMQGIAIDPATRVLRGGADPRRDGFVAPV